MPFTSSDYSLELFGGTKWLGTKWSWNEVTGYQVHTVCQMPIEILCHETVKSKTLVTNFAPPNEMLHEMSLRQTKCCTKFRSA